MSNASFKLKVTRFIFLLKKLKINYKLYDEGVELYFYIYKKYNRNKFKINYNILIYFQFIDNKSYYIIEYYNNSFTKLIDYVDYQNYNKFLSYFNKLIK